MTDAVDQSGKCYKRIRKLNVVFKKLLKMSKLQESSPMIITVGGGIVFNLCEQEIVGRRGL